MTAGPNPSSEPSDTRWLSPAEARSWVALTALAEVLPSALDAQLKRDAGMNYFEYQILAGLSDAPEHTMGMRQLAAFAGGSLSRLSHAVTRLERRGWATRSPRGVGRSVDIVMTPEGLAMMQRVAPGHVAEARRLVVDVLEPEQIAQLERCCRQILDAIDPELMSTVDKFLGHRAEGSSGDQ